MVLMLQFGTIKAVHGTCKYFFIFWYKDCSSAMNVSSLFVVNVYSDRRNNLKVGLNDGQVTQNFISINHNINIKATVRTDHFFIKK